MSALGIEPSHALPAPMAAPTLWLGGYRLHLATREGVCAELLDALDTGHKRQVFFANTNFVVQWQPLRARLAAASVRVVNDGIG